MFLRYIRLCCRLTTVSAFWGTIVLGSVYYTADGGEEGWYVFTMKNIPPIDDDSVIDDDNDDGEGGRTVGDGRRLWVPVVFCYLMTMYTFYLIDEEYKHYVELRMEWLAKGGGLDVEQKR